MFGQHRVAYLWLLVDLRVHVKTLGVKHNDVSLSDGDRAPGVQPQIEVLQSHTDVYGGSGQSQALSDAAVCRHTVFSRQFN